MNNVGRSQDDDQMDDRSESTPVKPAQTVGNQETLVDQRSPGINANGESQGLHGELLGTVHGLGDNEFQPLNLEQENMGDSGGPNVVYLDKITDGLKDAGLDKNQNGPNIGINGLGSESAVNLGKRIRGERSPLSIGSTQSPSQRLFNKSGNIVSEPLDLNTLIRVNPDNADLNQQ
ncbi:hypothetical protein Hanom_Chr02g00121771 [Helianthus anomalus]